MTSAEPRPLCGTGRCGQLLQAIAQRQATFPDKEGARLAAALVAVLRDHGLDPDAESVRVSVAHHLRAAAQSQLPETVTA